MLFLKIDSDVTLLNIWKDDNVHINQPLSCLWKISISPFLAACWRASWQWLTECQLNSNEIPVQQRPPNSTVSKPYLSPDFSAHQSYSCIFHFQSQITRHELYCHLSADMFKAQGPDVIQGLVFACNGHKMDLCSPVLKVMYSCDSIWKQIREVYCFTLSAQVFLYMLLGWGRRGHINSMCTGGGFLRTWERLKAMAWKTL